jgi:hypothetical protein
MTNIANGVEPASRSDRAGIIAIRVKGGSVARLRLTVARLWLDITARMPPSSWSWLVPLSAESEQSGRAPLVKPGFLNNREVLEWLEGVEPIWASLEFDSFCRLQLEPGEPDAAISFAQDLTAADLASAPIARNALLMLEAAEASGGLKLTTAGNLSRAVVWQLAHVTEWATYDLQETLGVCKRLNEADVWPLSYLRLLLTDLRFLRKLGGKLVLTAKGRAALAAGGTGDMLARMFEETFWRFNLASFDGYPYESWPQAEMALCLWCLAVGANMWERPDRIARFSTTPVVEVLEEKREFAGGAFEWRVLRFLTFFGVLEVQTNDAGSTPDPFCETRRRYRKTPFCDRFLLFDVDVEVPSGPKH